MAAGYSEFRDDFVAPSPTPFYESFGKRAFDIALLCFMAPVVLPLLAVILFVTAIRGGQPLYAQDRIGRGGRVFRCWKVRTMVPGAGAMLPGLLQRDPALALEWARHQKLLRDPRVTPVGAILRRTSLDELPQLWNVLNGTMSVVGPRPFLPEQQELYGEGSSGAAYYRCRPGITGLWQVCCRNRGSFGERAVYDTRYAAALRFGGDLKIILRTAVVVLRGTGV